MPEKEKTIWVTCASCGQESRKHRILHEKVVNWADEPYGPTLSQEFHRFVRKRKLPGDVDGKRKLPGDVDENHHFTSLDNYGRSFLCHVKQG